MTPPLDEESLRLLRKLNSLIFAILRKEAKKGDCTIKRLTGCLVLESHDSFPQSLLHGAVSGDIDGQRGHCRLDLFPLTIDFSKLLAQVLGLIVGICRR